MPHTKQQIMSLLGQYQLAPRHRFGQNFLIDLNLMRLFVDAAGLLGNETVLEVGHGTGSMTDLLAGQAGAVIAVDIDKGLHEVAKTALAGHANIHFHLCDILAGKSQIQPDILQQIDTLRAALGGPFYLIANLPYSISSPLLIDLLLLDRPPDAMFITVQEEVARRMVATPDQGKTYGTLGIMLQTAGSLQWLRTLPPQAFWPAPQVHSAMIVWRRHPHNGPGPTLLRALKRTIELLLTQRRKTLGHLIAKLPNRAAIAQTLAELAIEPQRRAETLTPDQFLALAIRHFQDDRSDTSTA